MNNRTAVYFGSFLNKTEVSEFVIEEMKKGKPAFMMQTYTCTNFPEKCENILPYVSLEPFELKESTPSGFALLKLKIKE